MIENFSIIKFLFNKIIKGVIITVLIVISLFLAKFMYELCYSPVDKALSTKENLVIIYRPDCSRCRKVMPYMIPRLIFSTKRDYILDARRLTVEEKRQFGENLTPYFKYANQKLQTINKQEILGIWKSSGH